MRYFKVSKFSFVFLIILSISFFFVSQARAVTPTLSVSTTSDGDTVQVYVTGDPNSSVLFFYIKNGSGQQINSLGNTNSSGTLATNISASSYNVATNSSVYVMVGGINGTQSPSVAWPTVSGVSNSNQISLNQTGVVLPVGQSTTLAASNLNSSSLYLSDNTNPKIANVNISGSQITIYANSYGTTVATVCLVSNSSNCSSVYITVQNSSVSPLSFSQNSVTLYNGQNVSITISGGSGSYYVANNSGQNQGAVTTSISGGTITLSTTSTTGSASVTVCSTDNSSCGIINVSIGMGNSASVSFSQTNPTVTVGQNTNVSLYGPTGSIFYVASNSNPSIVQPNLSGSTLTLQGITSGTSNISICVSTSSCGTLTVTVNTNTGTTNSAHPYLSEDNVVISVGQVKTVTISGGSMPYGVYSSSNNIFQSSLNSSILTLTGVSIGSGAMNVCSNSGGCSTLSVKVSATTITTTIPTGCIATTMYSPITGQYCGSVYAGTTTAVITSTDTSISTSTTTTNNSVESSKFKFTKPLKLGSKGSEVIELQKRLKELGYYKGKIDGGYGALLEKAVKAFQKAHKLAQLGNVGPGTRAVLNEE